MQSKPLFNIGGKSEKEVTRKLLKRCLKRESDERKFTQENEAKVILGCGEEDG